MRIKDLLSNQYTVILLMFLIFFFISKNALVQGFGGVNPTQQFKPTEVMVKWDSIIPSPDAQKSLTPKILEAAHIFPNSTVSEFDLDVALARVLGLSEVDEARWEIELLSGNNVRLIIMVRIALEIKDPRYRSGFLVSGNRSEFPALVLTDKSYFKFNLAGNLTPTIITNTWWGNGKTFTEFNPFGKNPPGVEPSLDFESYLIAGFSGITRLSKGKVPVYIYGTMNALGVTTLGDELYNANSNTQSFQIEEAYVGVVGSRTTSKGHLLRFVFSIGKQPLRIGNGMLICQIAGNGGTWGGMNAWPRFSGKLVGNARLSYDNWRFEGFYIQPNEYEGNLSNTKLVGINAEHNQSYGLSAGFTYLNVFKSDFPYFFPDFTEASREGLHAMNLRMQWFPRPEESFLFTKIEGGLQVNEKVPMLAHGLSFEGGWQFGRINMKPTLSYRYALLTGDNPETKRYERWDILYSGDDVTTWVQGPLMKNILFNTNLETSRFQLQLFPKGWRVTSQYSFFLANQLNTVPSPPVFNFASKQVGQELSLIVERFVSRNMYVRIMASSLWAGEGISEVLPNPIDKPWTEIIAMVKFSF